MNKLKTILGWTISIIPITLFIVATVTMILASIILSASLWIFGLKKHMYGTEYISQLIDSKTV